MIRDFRPTDTPRLIEFLQTQFPAEEALMGTRPEMFFRVVRAIQRWDRRLLLGLLRVFRRPIFRFLVVDEGGRAMGTTLLTFPGPAVYLSMVVTDPTIRRRGYAKALLERARDIARSLGRRYLVLDVLADNTPARTLYESRLGYGPLRETSYMVLDRPDPAPPERNPLPTGVRPYRKSDDRALLPVFRRRMPPAVAEVLPRKSTGLAGSGFERQVMGNQTLAWVVDRGNGAEAAIQASWNPNMEAAHFSDPILADTADPALVSELVRTASTWCWARGALRILSSVPAYNGPGRAALEQEGFHDKLSVWTLYRAVS